MFEVVLIEKIISVIDNKYEAVRVIAKEARRINSVLMRSEGEVDEKPTMMALRRVLDNKIKFVYGELDKKGPLFEDESE
jgi:DNA-directed RNA polymerase subunit K/omega